MQMGIHHTLWHARSLSHSKRPLQQRLRPLRANSRLRPKRTTTNVTPPTCSLTARLRMRSLAPIPARHRRWPPAPRERDSRRSPQQLPRKSPPRPWAYPERQPLSPSVEYTNDAVLPGPHLIPQTVPGLFRGPLPQRSRQRPARVTGRSLHRSICASSGNANIAFRYLDWRSRTYLDALSTEAILDACQ
jgi:hypothetical protein